jgi:Resolvase, N terminal domain
MRMKEGRARRRSAPRSVAFFADARRRRFDVLVCWRLDRLGRYLRHLVRSSTRLSSLGIGFVSLGEAIDTGTPAGRLQLHILAALAEFERARIGERVRGGSGEPITLELLNAVRSDFVEQHRAEKPIQRLDDFPIAFTPPRVQFRVILKIRLCDLAERDVRLSAYAVTSLKNSRALLRFDVLRLLFVGGLGAFRFAGTPTVAV